MLERQRDHLRAPTLYVLLKASLLGYAIGAAIILLGATITFVRSTTDCGSWTRLSFAVEYFVTTIIVPFLGILFFKDNIAKIIQSRRLDIACAASIGAIVGTNVPAFLNAYSAALVAVSAPDLTVILGASLALGALYITGAVSSSFTRVTKPKTPVFISDLEKTEPSEDLLKVLPIAQRFAQRVLNGGSADSMVFGVDAPWGAGKSTFINFCVDQWKNSRDVKIVVFHFSPLQYEDRKHLLTKFVDGVVLTIRENIFIPELRTVVSRYADVVRGEKKISVAGFDIVLSQPQVTVEKATDDIRQALRNLPARLVVIVDDLDRMEFSALKDILFVIKKGFSLPNVSFVLCYDTENIAALESNAPNTEKISEFLEKFVNVKVSLYPSSRDLADYVGAALKLAVAGNLQSDFKLLDDALIGLRSIYDSPDYYQYLPVVGDVRKIKRLLNTLVLLDIGQADIKNSDIDASDLIHLLLIYINYPALFRQIYITESEGRGGFFSAIVPFSTTTSVFENSPQYAALVKSLEDDGRISEKFLLDQLFSVRKRLKNTQTDSVPEALKQSLACFNDRSGRNLEAYLKLIVRLSQPPPADQYRYYVNQKNRVLSGDPPETIFGQDQFSIRHGEAPHEQMWRVFANSLEQFDAQSGAKLIRYLLKAITNHSAMEFAALDIGLRAGSLIYTLLKLVDVVGWRDERGLHQNNTAENIKGITDWIFGENDHKGEGIVDTFFKDPTLPLGLHDALIFRLYCCADRAGNLFNLSRAVGLHSDPTCPVDGQLSLIVVPQMRELSQLIFAKFRQLYIDARRNIFLEFDSLSEQQLAGTYYDTIEHAIMEGKVERRDVVTAIGTARAILKSFSVYQLANRKISSGIGCGYYDETGNDDQNGISKTINRYFFEVCFSPDVEAVGFRCFLNYLLQGFSRTFDSLDARDFKPKLDAICSVLDTDNLREYWSTYRPGFYAFEFEKEDTSVQGANYTGSYRKDLPALYAELDKLL